MTETQPPCEHDEDAMTTTDDDGLAPGELAVPDDEAAGTLEVFPPAQLPVMSAQVMLRQHASMMADAYKFADGICYTTMVPDQYRGKPKDGAAAILYGAELGLNPIASLQRVINVHGTPGLEARTMKALLKSKGFRFRTITKTETEFEIHAWEPDSDRRTDPPDEIGHWTIERARQAEYCPVIDPDTGTWKTFTKRNGDKATLGNMKYITDPIGMLEAKGTADVCRAIAPEILLGLPYASEELSTERWNDPDDDDRDDDTDRRSTGGQRARGTAALRDRAHKAAAAREPAQEPVDADEVSLTDETVADLVTETTLPATDAPEPTPDVTPETPVPDAVAETGGVLIAPVVAPEPAKAEESAAKPQAAAVAPEPPADMPMSPAVRSKGVDMANGLLINGGITDPAVAADALSEIAAKRPDAEYRHIGSVNDLTNTELKFLVDTLRAWKAQGNLESWLGEAVNNAGLREAGLLPGDAPDSAEDTA